MVLYKGAIEPIRVEPRISIRLFAEADFLYVLTCEYHLCIYIPFVAILIIDLVEKKEVII